ncbi:heterokaryon incompatibility protein-domain-containing protein, partial [Lophiotrema nucula]
SFSYPALPAGVDAIRVLTVEPGDFSAPLVGKLNPVAFSRKPRYVALSYTWNTSYPDNSILPISLEEAGFSFRSPGTSPNRLRSQMHTPSPGESRSPSTDRLMVNDAPRQATALSQKATSASATLTLNGHPFEVGRNLQLAILHLRSPKEPINLWADAVCINQDDDEERNQQVSLMAFIYTKAMKVVAWLGTRDYSSTSNAFRSMSIHWKAGQTQHLAAAIAGTIRMRYSPEPDQNTFVRIANSAFWKRLWVVQEVCLPPLLVFAYGPQVWPYEDFRQWSLLPHAGQGSVQIVHEDCKAMQGLLETRDKRHSDMMTIERLIERFEENECSEV